MNWEISLAESPDGYWRTWDELNRQTKDSPLLDSSVMRALLKEFGGGNAVFGLKKTAGNIVAAGIFVRSNPVSWQTFQAKNSPVGAWICQPDMDLKICADELCHELPGYNLAVGFSQLDPLFVSRPTNDENVSTLDYIETPRIEVIGNFTDYWQTRGKNLRHNIKRQTNRLARDGIGTELKILRDRADMVAAVADYGRIESAGWKGDHDSAVAADNAQGRFYSQILTDLSERREGVVLQYFFDAKLVASDLCILRKGTLIILKTTYDETVDSVSPAHLMRYETFQKMFNSGEVSVVEFYGPIKDWHRRWTEDIRTMYHFTYFRWSVLKKIRGVR